MTQVAPDISFCPGLIVSHIKDVRCRGIWEGVNLLSLATLILPCHSEQGLWKYKLVFESFLSLLTISDVGNDILWMGLRVKNNRGQWWRRWLRGNEGRTLQLGSSEGLFYVSNYCLYYWIMRNQPQEALVREHFMHKRQKKCTGIETETNMKRLMDRIIFQYYWNLLSWRNSSEKELMERRWIIPGSPGVPGKEPGFYYIYDRGALIHFKQASKISCFTF